MCLCYITEGTRCNKALIVFEIDEAPHAWFQGSALNRGADTPNLQAFMAVVLVMAMAWN